MSPLILPAEYGGSLPDVKDSGEIEHAVLGFQEYFEEVVKMAKENKEKCCD